MVSLMITCVLRCSYGRLDVDSEEDCAPPGQLPLAAAPFPAQEEENKEESDKEPVGVGVGVTPQQHLRDTFYRMDLDDRDIVALR